MQRMKKCVFCGCRTARWQSLQGGLPHCWDGCLETTGVDRRLR